MPVTLPRRTPRAAVLMLLALCLALLSGCLRYTEALSIGKDDTVSGIVVIAARKPGADGSSARPAVPVGQTLPQPVSSSPSIQVSTFDHEYESGYKVTFRYATFDEVAAFAPLGEKGGALKISRSGDELSISMTIDLTYAAKAEDIEYFKKTAKATVSLTVPGEVLSSNGEVSGQTITWTLAPLELNTIEATVRSEKGVAASSAERSIDPGRAALLVAIMLALLAGGWLLLRSRLRTSPPQTVTSRPAAPAPSRPVSDSSPRAAPAPDHPAPAHEAPARAAPAREVPPRDAPGRGVRPAARIPDPFGEDVGLAPQPSATPLTRPGGGWPPPRPRWTNSPR